MRFLKQKTLSKYSPSDQSLFTNHFGRSVMNLAGGLRLPKGTTDQRPQGTMPGDAPARTLNGANGFIRYNTSINPMTGLEYGIEAFVGGAWVTVRAPGASTIYKQTIPGSLADGTRTDFGPLTYVPASADNIIVLVENVFQISTTNFTLIDNYLGVSGSVGIQFTSPVPYGKDITIYFGFAD